MKRLFAFWIRREACRMAARAIQNHTHEDEISPRVWSLAVFFEAYMWEGAEGTQADFGPLPAVELSVVGKERPGQERRS
jgi:hypothetical protein